MKRTFRVAAAALLCTAAVAAHADADAISAQTQSATHGADADRVMEAQAAALRIREASGEIRIDGRLDEAAWAAATPVSLGFEVYPASNGAAPVATECRLLFDSAALYFGCVARDAEPGRIRAYVTDRDRTEGHDRIFLTLDPFADARRAFEFGVSALGVQHDRLRTSSPEPDDTWDAIWSSAGRIVEDGYVIEAAVPFRSLRFPEGSAEGWRFFMTREWPRGSRYMTRSQLWDRSDACVLCQTARLDGIGGVQPGTNVELTPTLTANRRDSRIEAGGLAAGDARFEPGLDARWSPTPNMALNATINPDFSQIEADAAQLQANNRFPLAFPEKRPFFLEGADLFSTPLRVVFTRTIADPVAGLKVSGKQGSTAAGAMVVRDELNNLLFPAHETSGGTSIAEPVTTMIARARRDVGASSSVGVLYTGREGSGYANRVGGVDALLRPIRSATASIQVAHSMTDYPATVAAANGQATGAFGGNAASLNVRYETREWNAELLTELIDPDFRADAGFIPQADIRRYQFWGGRSFWSHGSPLFSRFGVNGGGWHESTWDGRPTNRGVWVNAEYDGPLQTNVWINPNYLRQDFGGVDNELVQLWFGGSFRPTGAVRLELGSTFGDAIDFASYRKVDLFRVQPRVFLRAGRHLDVQLAYLVQRLSLEGLTVQDARVGDVRAIYNFTPRAFARAIVQYRDTERPPSTQLTATAARTRNVDVQLLFSYKVNPLTVFFLGYGEEQRGGIDAALNEAPLTRQGRAFFIKLGYAWRP